MKVHGLDLLTQLRELCGAMATRRPPSVQPSDEQDEEQLQRTHEPLQHMGALLLRKQRSFESNFSSRSPQRRLSEERPFPRSGR